MDIPDHFGDQFLPRGSIVQRDVENEAWILKRGCLNVDGQQCSHRAGLFSHFLACCGHKSAQEVMIRLNKLYQRREKGPHDYVFSPSLYNHSCTPSLFHSLPQSPPPPATKQTCVSL